MASRAEASSRRSSRRRRHAAADNDDDPSDGHGVASTVDSDASDDGDDIEAAAEEEGAESDDDQHVSKARKTPVPRNPRKRRRNLGLDPNTFACDRCDGVFPTSAALKGHIVGRSCVPHSAEVERNVEENLTDAQTTINGRTKVQCVEALSMPKSRKRQDVTAASYATPQPATTRRIGLRNRRNLASVTRVASKNDADDSDGSHMSDAGKPGENGRVNDDDDDYKEEPCESVPTSPKRRVPNAKKSDKDVCPHCQKEFSSVEGLNYHLARWVCRKEDCPDPKIVEQANRKRGRGKAYSIGGSAKKKWEKFRGPEAERICPSCDRIFTSIFGLQYHVKNNVCQQSAKRVGSSGGSAGDGTLAMPPLQPGDRFVTAFGVVEVIKDDRATPTGFLPENVKKANDKFVTEKGRLAERATRIYIARSCRLRARRMKVSSLYENGNVNRRSVAEAYSCFEDLQPPVNLVQPKDPTEPPESFPDRIVECVLAPDTRPRVGLERKSRYGVTKTDSVVQKTPIGYGLQTKLYLQRRLLHEPYHEGGSVYLCHFCNMKFGSLPGQKYHIDNMVCLKRGSSNKDKREAIERKINASANSLLELQVAPPKRIKTKKPRRKQDQGMYPEVLISLGFELLPEKIENVALVPNSVEGDTAPDILADVVGPDDVLQNLQEELKHIELRSDVQKYGSMYSEVFRSLGFRKPGKRKVSDRVNDVGTKKRRRRATKPKPILPPKPLPPIIDIQALVDEVDTGRYPSMSRVKDNAHQDNCCLCKDGGDLYCCDFCDRVEHLRCLRERFTVKEPEPDEDFMCHKCIQTVLSKRRRAEKRRTLKQEGEEEERRKELLPEGHPTGGPGGEYHFMAAKGQEVSELVELLQDAQLRLRQACETSKLNNIRRQIIQEGY